MLNSLMKVFLPTLNPETFELLLQNSHLGADSVTPAQELFEVLPYATQVDEVIQPHDRIVCSLQTPDNIADMHTQLKYDRL